MTAQNRRLSEYFVAVAWIYDCVVTIKLLKNQNENKQSICDLDFHI